MDGRVMNRRFWPPSSHTLTETTDQPNKKGDVLTDRTKKTERDDRRRASTARCVLERGAKHQAKTNNRL